MSAIRKKLSDTLTDGDRCRIVEAVIEHLDASPTGVLESVDFDEMIVGAIDGRLPGETADVQPTVVYVPSEFIETVVRANKDGHFPGGLLVLPSEAGPAQP